MWLASAKVTLAIASMIVATSVMTPALADDAASGTTIIPLLNKALADLPGKEATMLTVEYAPGAATPSHRHNAHTFVYVLEGSIVMQVAGGEVVTLGVGQTFYEAPSDVHAVSRNASKDKPAKFLVFLLKDKNAAAVLPPQ